MKAATAPPGPDPDMRAPFGVPPSEVPEGVDVTRIQLRSIWEYVLRRARGEDAEEAAAAVKGGIEPEEDEEADQWHDAETEVPMEGVEQQQGSGADNDDDGSGVTLAADEVIHVPQGDRPKVFAHPSQIMVAGATKSGKTTLVTQIIRHRKQMFDTEPEEVFWFYAMPSSVEHVPRELPEVKLRNGAPTEDMVAGIIKDGRPKVMIMDDMQQMIDNKNQAQIISDIFTKLSHHGNLSIIFIVQNLYLKNLIRIREQCGEIVIMGNGASAAANCMKLGRDLYMSRFLVDCMDKARARNASHPYVLVSTDANAQPFNVRYGITPGHPNQLFFLRKGTVTTPSYVKLKKHAEEGEKKRRQPEEAERGHRAHG
jgi:hypothetical protein